jgi:conjugative transfer signal peptidase TraF
MTELAIAKLRNPKIPVVALMLGAVLLILVSDRPHRPVLIWNASDSAAVGLYRLSAAKSSRGDLVAIHLPRSITDFADRRGYLPRGALLLKPIAAVAGDRVCRHRSLVVTNGALRALARTADNTGQPLPYWRGCHILRDDEVFFLSRHSSSFDSRYFGAVPTHSIVGRAIPVWTTQH